MDTLEWIDCDLGMELLNAFRNVQCSEMVEVSERHKGVDDKHRQPDRYTIWERLEEHMRKDERLWAGCMLDAGACVGGSRFFGQAIKLLLAANRRHPDCPQHLEGLALLRQVIGKLPGDVSHLENLFAESQKSSEPLGSDAIVLAALRDRANKAGHALEVIRISGADIREWIEMQEKNKIIDYDW
ncbi:MAG: hypothetical protein ACYTEQ_12365 [Planctomycetota bacterium]|jgi:hypothetical protein